MIELFPVKTIYPPAPKALDFYIIVAYWAPGGWWKIWPDQWVSEEKAELQAEKIPAGYTERQIFHICK